MHRQKVHHSGNGVKHHANKPLKSKHKTAFKTPPPCITPQFGLYKSARYPKYRGFYSPLLSALIIPQSLLPTERLKAKY